MDPKNNELRRKLDKMQNVLEDYEEGKPLPISINDIHFLIGACRRQTLNVDRLTTSYEIDFKRMNKEIDTLKVNFKNARKASLVLDQKVTKYKQIMAQLDKTSRWRLWLASSGLLKEYDSYVEQNKLTPTPK